MIIYLALLVAIVGVLMFALSKTNPDLKEIGRIMFWTGLLAFLLTDSALLTVIHR
jgi:hypothetical protein